MNKIILGLILASLLVVVPVTGLKAITDPGKTVPETDPIVVLKNITNWLFGILLLIAAVAIVIAGFYFVTSAGDPDKVSTARQFVLYAMVGVLVGLISKGLVMLVEAIVK